MIATISIVICGFLLFITQNLICFVQAKNNLSPFAPRISQYFFKNRKLFFFGLIGGAIFLSAMISGLSYNQEILWDAIKVRTVCLSIFVTIAISTIIIFSINKLFINLKSIEDYAYTHHATQLQHQSKTDYNKVIMKIASYYLSGYLIWLFLAIQIIYF